MSFRRRRLWTVVGLLVAVPAIFSLFAVFKAVTWATYKYDRAGEIGRVLWAIECYKGVHQHLPAAVSRDAFGRPMCSWRLALEPFLEQLPHSEESIHSGWFAPGNVELLHAAYGQPFTFEDSTETGSTLSRARLAAIVGPGTAFEDEFGFVGALPEDVILLIECADSDTYWTQPGDVDVRHVPRTITGGIDGLGLHVGFADGAVWYLDKSVPLETLKRFFTVKGARECDREEVLLPYRSGAPTRSRNYAWNAE